MPFFFFYDNMACSKDDKSSREVLLLVPYNQRCDIAAYGYAYLFLCLTGWEEILHMITGLVTCFVLPLHQIYTELI